MMESLRRRFSRPPEKDPWSTDFTFKPEISEISELRVDNSVLLAATSPQTRPASNDVDIEDYYRGVIVAAIQRGGQYRGQWIPVPWLRMTLAGLEHRPVPLETTWGLYQEGTTTDLSGYEELFSSEKIQ